MTAHGHAPGRRRGRRRPPPPNKGQGRSRARSPKERPRAHPQQRFRGGSRCEIKTVKNTEESFQRELLAGWAGPPRRARQSARARGGRV